MSKTKKEKRVIYPIHEIKEKGKLILPDKVITQINYLHNKIGNTEWSGILLYNIIKGSIADPENFELRAEHIFLMDIGTSGFTEYKTDADIVDIYDHIEEAMDMKMGHIHTHHTMTSFFSGIDVDELQTNVDKHNYYLSLIVNFSANYAAKVAFLSDVVTFSKLDYVDDSGKKKVFETKHTSKSMAIINMRICYEYNETFFYKRLEQIHDKIEQAKKKLSVQKGFDDNYNYGMGYGMGYGKGARKGLAIIDSKDIDSDPNNMTDPEIERLTRNIISVTPDLDEKRSAYTLLVKLAESNEKETDFYYEYLSQNLEEIYTNFFDQTLDIDELKQITTEIVHSIKRFGALPNVGEIVDNIILVLIGYINLFENDDDNDNDNNDNNDNILEKEISEIERQQ